MARQTAQAVTKSMEEREPRKPAESILKQQISSGLTELERSTSGLLMSGLSAGLDVGFSVFLMATLKTLDSGKGLPAPISELMVAAAYALGFILVIMGRSELFTEHTALAVLPVLNKRASLAQLMRLWGLVLASNLVGGAIFAALAVIVGPAMGVIDPKAFGEIAHGVVAHPYWVILLSGVLAGWLMGLVSWLVAASRDTVGQLLIILLITTTIGLAHLHHSIVGSIEVLTGWMAGQGITPLDYVHFLFWTVLGNSIGGVIFVAVVKYGQASRSNSDPTRPNEVDIV